MPHYVLPLSVHCFVLIARHLLWHEAMDSCLDLLWLVQAGGRQVFHIVSLSLRPDIVILHII